MRHPTASVSLVTAVLMGFALTGCEPAETEIETEIDTEVGTDIAVEGEGVSTEPAIDTTASSVWAHLQDEAYEQNWETWPGEDVYYQAGDPHGALVSTYLNASAMDGLAEMVGGEAGALPIGSMLVKNNYTPDSTLVAVTVMYKAESYDPDNNDWFWMKRLPDGEVEASGRVESCASCHMEGSDYLRTGLPDPDELPGG